VRVALVVVFDIDEFGGAVGISERGLRAFADDSVDGCIMQKFEIAIDVNCVLIDKGGWLFGALRAFWDTNDILGKWGICNSDLIRYIVR
jgi:hypothetical protein